MASRAYVEKYTKIGPFWSEILYDRIIKFASKPQIRPDDIATWIEVIIAVEEIDRAHWRLNTQLDRDK